MLRNRDYANPWSALAPVTKSVELFNGVRSSEASSASPSPPLPTKRIS
jgi:hypothetical protein